MLRRFRLIASIAAVLLCLDAQSRDATASADRLVPLAQGLH